MSKAIKKISDFISFAKLYFLVRNTRIAKHIAKEGLTIKRKNGRLWLQDFNIDIDLNKHEHILRGIRSICFLKHNTNFKLILTDKDEVMANVDDCNLYINSKEEIQLLNEVFAEHMYDIELPYQSIVLDIGMNIADTALYFASKKNVDLVRGYEPFKPTFEKALRNLELNPGLTSKIEAYNYGLSNREDNLECRYSTEHKGSTGISCILWYGEITDITKERIKIKPAADEVRRAKNDFPDHGLVLKVDCEGSEFEIIESLNKEKLLDQIDVILLEWHEKSPQVIVDALLKSGFVIFKKNNFNSHIGMLYAFRQQKYL